MNDSVSLNNALWTFLTYALRLSVWPGCIGLACSGSHTHKEESVIAGVRRHVHESSVSECDFTIGRIQQDRTLNSCKYLELAELWVFADKC